MEANDGVGINRKYKDTLFRFLFGENKAAALSLYNAVNGSSYTDEDGLEFTTLEDVIYMKFKNDVSFLFGRTLNLYEHQSSYNPNMPLRGLLYFADLYRQLITERERLYGMQLVKIPTPRYIVFYNGDERYMQEDQVELKLSDAFDIPDESCKCEWTAQMININHGHNVRLMEHCKKLQDYSMFIHLIRKNSKQMDLKEAIDKAVTECIEGGILSDILSKHQNEVKDMCLTEFNEQRYTDIIRAEGRTEGEEAERVSSIRKLMEKLQKTAGDAMDLLDIPKQDQPKYLKML